MKKFLQGILGVTLVVALLIAAGSSAATYRASAQAPTPSAVDEGEPSSGPFEPVLPSPATPDTPMEDLPPASGGSSTLESLENMEPDTLPELGPAACLQGLGEWESRAPLSAATYGAGVVSDGVYVYVAGGQTASGVTNRFARYDPLEDSWTTLAALPTAVKDALTLYAEGKIFVFGGVGNTGVLNLVQIYTIATNTWSAGTPMPGNRQQMSGGYHMGIIVAVGGYDQEGITPQAQTWGYSIAANSWAFKALMPAALGGAGSEVVNGHLFVIGGRDASHNSLNTVYDYSFAGNSWSTRAPVPTAVNFPGTAVYLNRIWVFGGGDPFNGVSNTQIYNPFYNTWSTGPALNSGRSFQDGVAVRNQIVSIGGWTTGYSDAVEVATQPPLNILIIYSDGGFKPTTLQFDLMAQPGVGQVDVYNGQVATPTLGQLQAYDIVIPFSNSTWSNAIALGNNLADFQDSGGVVVALDFDWSPGYAIAGQWQTSGYSPFDVASTPAFTNVHLGVIQLPGHPLLARVNTLSVYHHTTLSLASAAIPVAYWSDGTLALAYKGRAVGINAYLGDYNGVWSGDFAAVIANAGYLLRAGSPTCVSLSCQSPSTIIGALTDTDLVQTSRLWRDNPPSTCALPQSCAMNSDSQPHHYDIYPFVNNTGSTQCVSVTLDAGTCVGSNFIQSAAYLGSYNPANQCGNFLADIGASPEPVKSYSFAVGAWQTYQVVVLESLSNSYCPAYTLTVKPEACDIKDVFLPIIRR